MPMLLANLLVQSLIDDHSLILGLAYLNIYGYRFGGCWQLFS